SVTPQPGDAIVCTFVNKKDVPVKLVKDALPNSGQDFTFTASGHDVSNATLDDDGNDANGTASFANYTVKGTDTGQAISFTEGAVAGWALDSVSCTNNGTLIAAAPTRRSSALSVTPQPGDAIVCTFTNKKDVPVKLVKDAQPNSGQDFSFT